MNPRPESRCLQDIIRQPGELRKCLDRVLGEGRGAFDRASSILRDSSDLYISGIGASWSAGMGAQAIFCGSGRAAVLSDASELLHQSSFRPGSAILLLSRSGRSIEVVTLLERAARAGARVVGVTNDPESPLARGADAAIVLGVGFDHAISVVTYSSVALVAGLVAAAATGTLEASGLRGFRHALEALPLEISGWRRLLRDNAWFSAAGPTYFLARGASLASAHEARLMWEETAKAGASALTTGAFRHGAQEIVEAGLRVGLWVDPVRRRQEDLALARDLRRLGARVLAIGPALPPEAGDLVFPLPPVPAEWQFVIDIIPAQLAAEHLAGLRGVDCDVFRLSSSVVTSEGGLVGPPGPAS